MLFRVLTMVGMMSAALVPAGAQQKPINLDRFLAGIASCKESKDFAALKESLQQRFGNAGDAKEARVDTSIRIEIPSRIAEAFGAFASKLSGDTTEVTAPVKGTFQGLKVKGIGFNFGNQIAILEHWVDFEEPRPALVKRYGASLKKATDAYKEEGSFSAEIAPDLARISCSFSF